MDKNKAYEIINGIGGICATFEECEEAMKVLRGNKIVKPRTEVPNDNRCIDCRSLIVDEFPEVPYIGCSGCPRIYARKKGD
jgi:hypothetical protein